MEDRTKYIIESFDENFLEFRDDGYSYKMKLYSSSKKTFGRTFKFADKEDTINQQVKYGFYDTIMFYIITPFDTTSDRIFEKDIQTSKDIFEKSIKNTKNFIENYYKSSELLKDNIDRLINFYKLEMVDNFYISKYRYNDRSDYKLAFSIKIKIK